MVRIVPNTYTEMDDYGVSIICDIDDNGNFGSACWINSEDQSQLETTLADSSETYEFIVFANIINTDEYNHECEELTYKHIDSVNDWTSIEVKATEYFQSTADECGI